MMDKLLLAVSSSEWGLLLVKFEIGRHSTVSYASHLFGNNIKDTPANALAKCEMALCLLQVQDPAKLRYNGTI